MEKHAAALTNKEPAKEREKERLKRALAAWQEEVEEIQDEFRL